MSTKLYTPFVIVSLAVLCAWGLQLYYLDIVLPRQWRLKNKMELQRIFEVDPMAAVTFSGFIDAVEDSTTWLVSITSGLRTPEHQAKLKRENAKNAAPFKSKHVKGQAIDINLHRRMRLGYHTLVKDSSRKRWLDAGVLRFAKAYALTWGGNFKTYHDPVHFEIK